MFSIAPTNIEYEEITKMEFDSNSQMVHFKVTKYNYFESKNRTDTSEIGWREFNLTLEICEEHKIIDFSKFPKNYFDSKENFKNKSI